MHCWGPGPGAGGIDALTLTAPPKTRQGQGAVQCGGHSVAGGREEGAGVVPAGAWLRGVPRQWGGAGRFWLSRWGGAGVPDPQSSSSRRIPQDVAHAETSHPGGMSCPAPPRRGAAVLVPRQPPGRRPPAFRLPRKWPPRVSAAWPGPAGALCEIAGALHPRLTLAAPARCERARKPQVFSRVHVTHDAWPQVT